MDKHSAKLVCLPIGFMVLQWNISNTDTLGTKVIVLISEVSLFQGENDMYLCEVQTQSSSVVIKQGLLNSVVYVL